MPLFLLNFFRGVKLKHLMYAAAGAAIAFVVWQGAEFVNDKIEADKRIVVLEQQVEDYKEAVQVLEDAAAQKDRALEAADAARAERDRLRDTHEEIRRDAASATEEEDGPVAPVLRRTLDALDGL